MVVGAANTYAASVTFYNVGGWYSFSHPNIPVRMTPDGSAIANEFENTDGVFVWREAFRWTEATGVEGLGVVGTYNSGDRYSQTLFLSDDGATVVGVSSNSDGVYDWSEGFRWTEAGGLVGFGVLGVWTTGNRYSQPTAMTADGATTVGVSSNSNGNSDWSEAFTWTEAGGLQGLGYLAPLTNGDRQSSAYLLSADGTVVVGDSSNSNGSRDWYEAFRWTDANGMEGLGILALRSSGFSSSSPSRMTADASVIVGSSSNTDGVNDWQEAFRWTETGGMVGLGYLGVWTSGFRDSFPTLLSEDGAVVVGYSFNSNGVTDWQESFRWTQGTGMQPVGYLGVQMSGNRFSYADRMTADGSVLAGTSSNSNGVNDWSEAFRWTVANGIEGLGVLGVRSDGYRYSSASFLSADGSVVAGYSSNSNGVNDWDEAFRWTETGGMQGLGYIGIDPGGYRYSYPTLMLADGSVIFGQSLNSDGVDSWREAFRWDTTNGMQSVADWIGPTVNLTGLRLESVDATNADGSIVAGRMQDPGGFPYRAYWARAGGFLQPDVLAASLDAMLPLGPTISAMGSSSLDTLGEIAAHHRCGGADDAFCIFAAASAGQYDDALGNRDEAPAGTFGVTAHVAPNWRVGLGALINRASIDGLAYESEHKFYGGGAAAFLAFGNSQEGLSLEASGIVSMFEADISRGYLNGIAIDVSESTSSGTTYGAALHAGWTLIVADSLRLMPFASASLLQTNLNAFSETSGPFPATFNEQDQTSTRTRLGGELSGRVFENVALWTSAAWAHRFEDTAAGISGDVSGIGAFALPGAPLETDWAEGVFGFEIAPIAGVLLTGSVTGRSSSTGDVPEVEGRIALSVRP